MGDEELDAGTSRCRRRWHHIEAPSAIATAGSRPLGRRGRCFHIPFPGYGSAGGRRTAALCGPAAPGLPPRLERSTSRARVIAPIADRLRYLGGCSESVDPVEIDEQLDLREPKVHQRDAGSGRPRAPSRRRRRGRAPATPPPASAERRTRTAPASRAAASSALAAAARTARTIET